VYRYNFWNEVEIKTGCSVFLFTCKTSVISLHGSRGETSFLDKFYGVSFFQSIFYLEVMFGFWYFKQLLIWRGEQLLWSHGQLCHSVIICLFLKPVCYSKTRKGLDMVFMFMLLFQSLCIILELIRRVLLLSSEQYNVYKSIREVCWILLKTPLVLCIKKVFYSIPCSCGMSYIGETGCLFQDRLREHYANINHICLQW